MDPGTQEGEGRDTHLGEGLQQCGDGELSFWDVNHMWSLPCACVLQVRQQQPHKIHGEAQGQA